jgi:hypothetical protein
MTHTMTRWIEIADERQFNQATVFDRAPRVIERHHLHLGSAILHLPCRLIDALSHCAAHHSSHH